MAGYMLLITSIYALCNSLIVGTAALMCEDLNVMCPTWARRGECIRTRAYMMLNCKRSCRICPTKVVADAAPQACNDRHYFCSYWASTRQCTLNRAYMQINCRKSCQLCGSSAKITCKDNNRSCGYWAKTGQCSKNPAYMHLNCKKSCKLCPRIASSKIKARPKKPKKQIPKSVVKKVRSRVINEQVCGIRARSRVVGGTHAKYGEWPWQVGIVNQKKFGGDRRYVICGGSLINNQWVLTAAHCFGRPQSTPLQEDIIVRIAEHDLKTDEGVEMEMNVTKIIKHTGYKIGSYDNDIALLKLAKSVKYTQLIKPVCLPKSNKNERAGQSCTVIGWGRVQEFGPTSKILKKAKVPIIQRKTCKETLQKHGFFTDNMLCAGYKDGKVDACAGDSGGPLLCRENHRFELTGIVSWGTGCGRPNAYGAYTKVSNYIDWIIRNIKNNR